MANRELDPEALKKAHAMLIEKIEKIEKMQHKVGQGDLKFAPAFGLVSNGQNGNALQRYAENHEMAWQNMDKVRRGYYAALASLESRMKEHGITEFENVRELDTLTKDDPNS